MILLVLRSLAAEIVRPPPTPLTTSRARCSFLQRWLASLSWNLLFINRLLSGRRCFLFLSICGVIFRILRVLGGTMSVPRTSLCLLVCLVVLSAAFAQVDTGTIAGSVRDSSGCRRSRPPTVRSWRPSTNATIKTQDGWFRRFRFASFAAGQLQGDCRSARIQDPDPGHARRRVCRTGCASISKWRSARFRRTSWSRRIHRRFKPTLLLWEKSSPPRR